MRRSARTTTAARPLWSMRATAGAPRLALLAACAAVVALEVRSAVLPLPPSQPTGAVRATDDIAAQTFAEEFARAYLQWDARRPEAHEREVARFLGGGIEAGVLLPAAGTQRVNWTAVASVRAARHARRIVTVAAETTRGRVDLGVTVGRDKRGRHFIASPPAILGPAAPRTGGTNVPEREVEDRALRAVAVRVIRNYLAGDHEDLAADLDSRALVSPPRVRLRVHATDAITWVVEPRRVAVRVSAEARRGPRLDLRYELSVLRLGGRWVVRTIHTNPIAREGDR